MSNFANTKSDASKAQSAEDKNDQNLNASAKQSVGDQNLNAAQEATAKGFATTSSNDKESTKPDPSYTKKIRED